MSKKEKKEPKPKVSVLAPFEDKLEQWFEEEGMQAKEVQRELEKVGCRVLLTTLYSWWSRFRQRRQEKEVLTHISDSTRQWRKYEAAFDKNSSPPIEHLLKLLRVVLLELNSKVKPDAATLRLIPGLMRPLIQWNRLEEQRKRRRLTERARRQELATRKAVEPASGTPKGLKPETLRLIEAELNLL